MTKTPRNIEWKQPHGWDHLEYAVFRNKKGTEEQLLRWSGKENPMAVTEDHVHVKGYPKWRCKWCHELIPPSRFGTVGDWSKHTPCPNENCKLLFELSGGERDRA